jgi:hypothetical protein
MLYDRTENTGDKSLRAHFLNELLRLFKASAGWAAVRRGFIVVIAG